jgi:hypothetical protein
MTLPWEGVPLAPRQWPGQDKVLTLAATIKLMFGKEFEVVIRPNTGGRQRLTYTSLPLDVQIRNYYKFKDYYDHNIQRTLE